MKILAYSDLHGNISALKSLKKKSKDADLVIDAGDISIFEHEISMLMKEVSSFHAPVLMIHGNHESPSVIRHLCAKHKNLRFIHEKAYAMGNYVFLGYGGGGFSYTDQRFMKVSKRLRKMIPMGSKVVLVLHGPPFGTKLDSIWGEHAGNKSYRRFIEKVKPALVICGHLHENQGMEDRIGDTRLINPGPKGKIVRI